MVSGALLMMGCGGAVVNIDGSDAASDSASDSQSSGNVECNGKTCGEGEACVVTTSGGGACELPDDAGVCPNGSHTTGCCDNTTTTFACQKLPSACNGALSCPCAESLCQCGGCNLEDAGVLSCGCMYP